MLKMKKILSGMAKKVGKVWKKIRVAIITDKYYRVYEKGKLKEKAILVESKDGMDLAGNMFAILKELSKDKYKDYTVYLSRKKEKHKAIETILKNNNITNVKYVTTSGYKYYCLLASVKYLFTDTSFARMYIKKEGQIITNTWHGTPLKLMGKQVRDRAYAMGNVQRNLQMADYLAYPNRYMKEIMFGAYCLDNIYPGTILWSGYPRNAVFFNEERAKEIRQKIGYQDKKVYVYMPTWRGTLNNLQSQAQIDEIEYLLLQLDKQLDDDMIVLAKMHPFVKDSLNLDNYVHIKVFPGEYDSYEVLNAADGLITDYSSVFFDFMNTRKKVILWAYDFEAYLGERGVYVPLESMPFPIVRGIKELVEEMRKDKEYDESEFLERCGVCDNPNAAERICERVLFGKKTCPEEKSRKNGKENVLFYVSTLAKNGITTSIMSLLEHLDLTEKNYYAVFRETTFKRYPERLEILPEEFAILPISAEPKLSFKDKLASYLYYNKNKNGKWIQKQINKIYDREMKRHFYGVPVDYAVHFTGYEKHIIKMFEKFDAVRSIFVHNDMIQELKTKSNQHRLTLEQAYQNYDYVAMVTEDLYPSTMEISNRKDNLIIVNNCHDYKSVLEKGEGNIEFQKHTVSTHTVEEVKNILSGAETKFITIGRFSQEKGHEMLIHAFEKYHRQNPESKLIIIGGYGNLYNQTVKLASESSAGKDIVIIKQINNPMPILKKCDLFILSSLYEGFGLVLLEADTLSVPVMSTEIVGPTGFMKAHGGYLVSPDTEGIYAGMQAYERGEIPTIGLDYEEYNKSAARQFEVIIGKRN